MENIIKKLSDKLDTTAPELAKLDSYWDGTQPAAFLSKASREALGDRLRVLSVNFPRLAVQALTERLNVTGFRLDEQDEADADLWKSWRRNGMEDAAPQAHADALIYGRSFITVWADAAGRPLITIESPNEMAVLRDPATRAVTAAFKRWAHDSQGYGVLYLADRIVKLTASGNITGNTFPSTGWKVTEEIPNPLGMVPVIPLVNRGRLSEVDGVSEMSDVLDLADALNKLMSDAMVTSEHFARPRRWATGLELVEDEAGNVVNPFPSEATKLWQSEAPETKFGQFDGARLDGYADLTATVTQQIGALTGLPPHYLGLNGDQPPSADAIRSAEASLASRAYSLQRSFGMAWAEVAKLAVAVRDGVDPYEVDLEVLWASPEVRTPAQSADAAVKLKDIGLPLSVIMTDTLGFTPAQVERVREAVRIEALDSAGIDLTELAQ